MSTQNNAQSSWYAAGLWQKPRLTQPIDLSDTAVADKDVTTSELFFDLIYATAIARLGDYLRDDDIDFPSYFLYFLTIWFMWQSSTEYSTRFNTDDLFNKMFVFGLMSGVLGLTIHMSNLHDESNEWYFAACACYLRFITGSTYVRIAVYVQEARAHATYTLIIAFVEVGLWSIFLWNPGFCKITTIMSIITVIQICQVDILLILSPCIFPASHYRVMMDTYTDPLFAPWYDRVPGNGSDCVPNPMIPYSLKHYNERYGCIILVVLGEMVDGISEHTTLHSADFYISAICGFLCLVGLKMLYFDTESVTSDHHPIKRHRISTWLYIRIHPFLCISLAVLGSGLHLICGAYSVESANSHRDIEQGRYLVALSLGCSLLLVTFLDLTKSHDHTCSNVKCAEYALHASMPLDQLRRIHNLQVMTNVVGSGVCFGLGFFFPNYPTSAVSFLGVMAFIVIFNVAVNLLDEVVQTQTYNDENYSKMRALLEEQHNRSIVVSNQQQMVRDIAEESGCDDLKLAQSLLDDVRLKLRERGMTGVTPEPTESTRLLPYDIDVENITRKRTASRGVSYKSLGSSLPTTPKSHSNNRGVN